MRQSGDPPEALLGKVLAGRYRVLQLLGSGGTGDVYVAERCERPGDRLALKMLRREHRGSPAMIARFEREAAAAARVRHPNVLAVEEIQILEDAERFFAMELLEGLDLADTLASTGSLVPGRAVRIAHGLASALGAAHAAGVVHRDVKPENVFLVHAPDGRELVKLLDFGFAWVGEPSVVERERIPARQGVVGTPEYMAPEQARGAAAHATADVYSLGIVLFEMLAGRAPFLGDSNPAIAYKHAVEPLPLVRALRPSLRISMELEAVVRRALARDPADRFAAMSEVTTALLATPELRSG